MIKFISFSLLFISSNALSETCNYQWNVKVNGLNAGTAYDKIINHKNYYSVSSTFKVNKLFSYFNVNEYIRTFSFNKNTKEIIKEDFIIGQQHKDKIWRASDRKISVDDRLLEYTYPIIDSTIFPYLKLLNPEFIDGKYTVLGKTNIYDAEVKYSNYELLFNAVDKSGKVTFKDGKPYFFDFKSGLSFLSANLINFNCSD